MKQLFIVAILLFLFTSCSEEKTKISQLPISSTNIEAISFFNQAKIHEQNFEFDEAKALLRDELRHHALVQRGLIDDNVVGEELRFALLFLVLHLRFL